MDQTHAALLIFAVFAFAMILIGMALTGYGSTDRTHEKPPHLPGHDVQDNRSDRHL